MTILPLTAQDVYNPVSNTGSPRGANMQEAQAYHLQIESLITAITTNGGLAYTSRASLYADLDHEAGVSAWVIGDSTAAYNGIYVKSGASGAGSWAKIADLPYSYIPLSNTDSGDENAITATSSLPVPSAANSALLQLNIVDENTGAVTLAVNGDTAKPIVTNKGDALVSGYLEAGMTMLLTDTGSNYQLFTYGSDDAVLAAAEAAQAAAEAALEATEDARDIALAASGRFVYKTRSDLVAALVHEEWEEPTVGTIFYANDIQYRWVGGSTAVPDLSGFEPAGELSVKHFGVSADIDSTVGLRAALTYANGQRILTNSKIKIDGDVDYSGPINVVGDNYHNWDFSGGGTFLTDQGLEALPLMSSDVGAWDNTISFASDHNLQANDVFCLYNPTDESFSNHRPSYRAGEWFKVSEILSSTAVKIFGHPRSVYASPDVECYKMGGGAFIMKDVPIIPKVSGEFFKISLYSKVRLSGLSCPAGNANRAIYVDRCFDVNEENNDLTALEGNAYPITFGNCQNVTSHGTSKYSDRHCLSIGGASGPGCVPTRNVLVHDSILTNSDTGTGAGEAHGISDLIRYDNCIFDSGFSLGGRDVSVSNSTIRGRNPNVYPDGLAVFSSELVGGLVEFDNCIFEVAGNASAFGVIDIVLYNFDATYHDPAIRTGITENLIIKITNCSILHRGSVTTTPLKAIRLFVGNTEYNTELNPLPSHKITLILDGLVTDLSEALHLINISGTNDVSNLMKLWVGDNLVFPPSALVGATNAANSAMPMRLPMQHVLEETSYTTDESSIVGINKSFKWTYPREPKVAVSMQKTDGTAFNIGTTQLAIPYAYDTGTSFMRMAIKSSAGANFTIANSVTLNGQAWINDF